MSRIRECPTVEVYFSRYFCSISRAKRRHRHVRVHTSQLLNAKALEVRDALLEALVVKAREHNNHIISRYESILGRIAEKPVNEADLAGLRGFIADLKEKVWNVRCSTMFDGTLGVTFHKSADKRAVEGIPEGPSPSAVCSALFVFPGHPFLLSGSCADVGSPESSCSSRNAR